MIKRIVLLHCGVEKNAMFKTLQLLEISRMHMYLAANPFEEIGRIDVRSRSGRHRTIHILEAVKAVEANPHRKQKVMSREMQISRLSMSNIIRKVLGLGASKRHREHLLTVDLKKMEIKSKHLLVWYGENRWEVLFTYEKKFNVEEHFNKQNDKVYSQSV